VKKKSVASLQLKMLTWHARLLFSAFSITTNHRSLYWAHNAI